MIYNNETRQFETIAQLRNEFPSITIPRNLTPEQLATFGRVYVEPTEPPEGDVVTQGEPAQDGKGVWRQMWQVRDYTPEELAEQLESRRADKLNQINAGYQSELDAILSDYPSAETKTWDKQEAEARAWQADNSASTPLLDAVAAGRDMDKAELVQRVLAKADAWIALSGAATGKRQRLEDEISKAKTLEALDAIQW